MRICYVCSFREDSGGGVSQVVTNLSNYFSKDHTVLIVSPGSETRYFFDRERNIYFLEIFSIGNGLLYIPKFRLIDVIKIYRYLKHFSPQITHIHDEGPIPLLILAISLFLQVKTSLSFHMNPVAKSPVIDDLFLRFNAVFKAQNNIRLSKLFCQVIDVVIFPGNSLENSLDRICSGKKKVSIPNSIDFTDFALREKRQRFSLVFIGHIIHDKGCDYLVEVMRYLPQKYTLTLVGETPNPKYYYKLQQKIKEYKLNNIKFTGKVTHAQISGILAKSHLLTSASLLEVQSLAILEALASGTPVVSLSNPTTDEFIDKSVGENFPQATPPSVFARKVEELCELNYEQYDTLSKNATRKVSHLSLETVGQQTLKVYEDLVLQGSSPKYTFMFMKYTVLALVFAKCVRILYFLESTIKKYERKADRKS